MQIAKAHALITSPKIKNLASKALKSPSTLTTEKTRELGGSVMAHIERDPQAPPSAKKTPPKKQSTKKTTKTERA